MKNSIHVWSDRYKNPRGSRSRDESSDFIRPIKEEFKQTIDELVASLARAEEERKQKTQRIEEIKKIIEPLEEEIAYLQDEVDDAYRNSFNKLKALRGRLSISDVWAIHERVEQALPWFDGMFNDSDVSNLFFRSVDLDLFLWHYGHLRWIDWDDFDDFLINGETGKKMHGIEGGLEIYQDCLNQLKNKGEDEVVLPPDGHPCIYLLRDRKMNVIYVGQSKSIRGRLKTHLRDRGKGEAEIFDVIRIRSADDLDREEYRMIKKYSPRLNKFVPKDKWSIDDGQQHDRTWGS